MADRDFDAVRQRQMVSECIKRTQDYSFFMRRAIDSNDLNTAIDRAIDMLKELKTNHLGPKSYYELYNKVHSELRYLEDFFVALNQNGTPMVKLYEQVQTCSTILPRLYLLITAGACYIRSGEAPACDVLSDLAEMAKGVQHPMRGLFLRSYLDHATKDKLPDEGSPYAGEGRGCVMDAVEFLLDNFVESNRLWVRMHVSGQKGTKKKDNERRDLRVLVGTNIERLSNLQGMDAELYKTCVLPRILEQCVTCRDTVAQSYLMDITIQAFPDDFHVSSLGIFLEAIGKLKEKVRVRPILESLMHRLTTYAETAGGLPIDVYTALAACAAHIVQERANFPLSEAVLLQSALANMASTCYPDRLDLVDGCLYAVTLAIVAKEIPAQGLPDVCIEPVTTLLDSLVTSMGIKALTLPHFGPLAKYLPAPAAKAVARNLIEKAMEEDTLTDATLADTLLAIAAPLLDELSNAGPGGTSPTVDEDLSLVARLIHTVPLEADTDVAFEVLSVFRRHMCQQTATASNPCPTTLVFALLNLAEITYRKESIHNKPIVTQPASPPPLLLLSPKSPSRTPVATSPLREMQPSDTFGSDSTLHVNVNAHSEISSKNTSSKVGMSPKLSAKAVQSPPKKVNAATAIGCMPSPTSIPGVDTEALKLDAVVIGSDGHDNGDLPSSGVEVQEHVDGSGVNESAEGSSVNEISEAELEVIRQVQRMKEAKAAAGAGVQPSTQQENTDAGANEAPSTQNVTPAVDTQAQQQPTSAPEVESDIVPPPELAVPAAPVVLRYSSKKVFQLVHEVVTGMAPQHPALAQKLFLESALAADRCVLTAILYEFLSQAFIIYEDDMADARNQLDSLISIISTLAATSSLSPEDHETLSTKAALHGARLLRRPDQCRAVALCTHLFWGPEAGETSGSVPGTSSRRDPQRVLECLQRALVIADVCMGSSAVPGASIVLFVEILNYYVYFFEANNAEIQPKYLSGLVALIREHLGGLDLMAPGRAEADAFFQRTLQHMRNMQAREDVPEPLRTSYAAVEIDP